MSGTPHINDEIIPIPDTDIREGFHATPQERSPVVVTPRSKYEKNKNILSAGSPIRPNLYGLASK